MDIETSGLNDERDRVISVSADKIEGGKLTEQFFSLIPRFALEETIRDIKTNGKTALIGAVESETYGAVIGCCKNR